MNRRILAGAALLGAVFVSAATAEVYQSPKLAEDGIHDPTNEAVKNVLQEPGEAMVDFPMDRKKQVDWVKAIDEGLINPRKSISGDEFEGEIMQEMDLDIIMKQTAYMPNVRFPHLAHTKWLACSNCHPDIFIPQVEANPVSMDKILKGEFCGRCHDKVSFAVIMCERCHSVAHDQSSPAYINKK